MKSEEAKKMNDRFAKHLKDANGVLSYKLFGQTKIVSQNLVCTRCKVACRSDAHFVIHLSTYDHRLKVVSRKEVHSHVIVIDYVRFKVDLPCWTYFLPKNKKSFQKGTPMELLSLLVGFFHRKEYLELVS